MQAKMETYHGIDLRKLGCEDANWVRLHESHDELSGSITGTSLLTAKLPTAQERN
jgi:uncharacterized protein YdcH (DUF465 family)